MKPQKHHPGTNAIRDKHDNVHKKTYTDYMAQRPRENACTKHVTKSKYIHTHAHPPQNCHANMTWCNLGRSTMVQIVKDHYGEVREPGAKSHRNNQCFTTYMFARAQPCERTTIMVNGGGRVRHSRIVRSVSHTWSTLEPSPLVRRHLKMQTPRSST